MTGRWLFAVCLVLLGCILALALDANRSLSAPPHLPQLVAPAGPARLEDMAFQRNRSPLPIPDGGFMALPYVTVAPDVDQQAPLCPESEGWNA